MSLLISLVAIVGVFFLSIVAIIYLTIYLWKKERVEKNEKKNYSNCVY